MTLNCTNPKLEIPKEYLRIASRFVKEVGLYHYWMQYLYDPNEIKNWYNPEYLNYNDISVLFAATNFTTYLSNHGIQLGYGNCFFYEVFVDFVREFYPEYMHTIETFSTKRRNTNLLIVNREKKEIKLIYFSKWK